MNLNKEIYQLLTNAVELSTVLGIEKVVLDNISLRGQNKEDGIAIIKSSKDLDMDFDAIGLGRLSELKSRINVFKSPTITYETTVKNELTNIIKLNFKENKTKIGYRCYEPRLIEAPKAINDPVFYSMEINENDIEFIIKGITTMGSSCVNFTIEPDNKNLVINISDNEGDMFTHTVDTVPEINEDASILSKSYKSKVLRTIFNNYIKKDERETFTISITKRGVMLLVVNDISVYLFPER